MRVYELGRKRTRGLFKAPEWKRPARREDEPDELYRMRVQYEHYLHRVAVEGMRHAWHASRRKRATWGGRAWSVNPITATPYPAWDDLADGLDVVRRRQRNERRRVFRQGRTAPTSNVYGVTTRNPVNGAGYRPSGAVLIERSAAREALRAERKMHRRIQRHGEAWCKHAREVLGQHLIRTTEEGAPVLTPKDRAMARAIKAHKGPWNRASRRAYIRLWDRAIENAGGAK